MRVALGSDHGGFELKQEIIKYLEEKQIAYKDYGCHSTESTDYPIYAKKVAHGILAAERTGPAVRRFRSSGAGRCVGQGERPFDGFDLCE